MAMQIDFPFHFDVNGRTAQTDDADHVRDMIELLLFTRPGERVNRPDFGSGLYHAVFAPNSPELATALEHTTRAALQRYLGDVIEVRQLTVLADDAALRVNLIYALRSTGEQRSEAFTLPSASGTTGGTGATP